MAREKILRCLSEGEAEATEIEEKGDAAKGPPDIAPAFVAYIVAAARG